MNAGPTKASFEKVLKMQSANMLQKTMLDVLTTKVLRVKSVLTAAELRKPDADEAAPAFLEAAVTEALRVLSMDRIETLAMRPTIEFDNVEIQAILSKAMDDMTAVLMRVPD